MSKDDYWIPVYSVTVRSSGTRETFWSLRLTPPLMLGEIYTSGSKVSRHSPYFILNSWHWFRVYASASSPWPIWSCPARCFYRTMRYNPICTCDTSSQELVWPMFTIATEKIELLPPITAHQIWIASICKLSSPTYTPGATGRLIIWQRKICKKKEKEERQHGKYNDVTLPNKRGSVVGKSGHGIGKIRDFLLRGS